MALKAAFIFLSPEGNPEVHNSTIDAESVYLSTFAVRDYRAAEELAKNLVTQGYEAVELCGGFGTDGVAKIKEAVKSKAVVGVVRFDNHPGLGFKSGDDLFC